MYLHFEGGPVSESAAHMNTVKSYITMLTDSNYKDDQKLKAAQAVSEDLEVSTKLMFL